MHEQYVKRQTDATSSVVSVASYYGESTIASQSIGSSLYLNPNTLSYNLQPSVTITSTSIVSLPSTSSAATPITTAGNSNSNSFSIGAVLGICIGAFIGAGLLIFLSVYLYRRSSRRPAANDGGAAGRDRKWDQLADLDMWDGKAPVEVTGDARSYPSHPPASESVGEKGAIAHSKSTPYEEQDIAAAQFSTYHPNLAEQLAAAPLNLFMGQKDSVRSWDGTTMASGPHEDFLSHVHVESGTMSPILNISKMTPPATSSTFHRWESAEVILPDEVTITSQEPENPFVEKTQRLVKSKSFSNPFFGAQQRRPSIGRRATPESDQDPFADKQVLESLPPRLIQHVQSDSVTSTASTVYVADRAMKSLIAALDLPKEEIERRLRIASMQPSEISNYSFISEYHSAEGPDDASAVH